MARDKSQDATQDLLRTLVIIQLANAGATQQDIRKFLGCDINVVSRVVKILRHPGRKA
jgi:hypothetical protein